MTRLFLAFAFFGMIAVLTLPTPAGSAEPDGMRTSQPHEFSSRHRGTRIHRTTRLHYYDPYPWWWHPPHVKRARTNYLGWPHSYYPPDYDKPYFDGVVGYPAGFGFYGL